VNIYYVDGKFVPADEAAIPVDDLAILRGFGVFDLLRTYNGKPFFLDEHVERLEHSAREIGLELPWSHNEIVQITLETLRKNDLAEANLRIVVTGGSSPDFMTPQGKPRLLVLVTPIPQLPDWWFSKGVKIITIVSERHIPGAKTIGYVPATMALRKAKKEGAIEALYIDRDDFVLECTTSNLFALIGGTLVTPGRDILSGITRKVILDIARDRFPIDIRDISRKELLKAQEVFITGTNKGIVPVIQVDDAIIAKGRPGHHTREIMSVLDRKILDQEPQ
jgi:branched-chain amino acid aminotransferase